MTFVGSKQCYSLYSYLADLERIFSAAKNRHEAHQAAIPVIEQMTRDSALFRQILCLNFRQPKFFNREHYPCPSLIIGRTRFYELVCNCWIPLPDKSTDISTKALHHHADMLLTTGTAFGPGYEHWMLEKIGIVSEKDELFAMKLIESSKHRLHNVCFVDKGVVHVPLYPPSLTITYALWSRASQTSLLDQLKGSALLYPHIKRLKEALLSRGMYKVLANGYPDYLDFYPVPGGFRGVRRREDVEFKRGPVCDHIQSIFHIVQATENSDLVDEIERIIEKDQSLSINDRNFAHRLIACLRVGELIEGRLTPRLHYGILESNFSRQQILDSLYS